MNTLSHKQEQGVSMLLIMVIILAMTTIIFGGMSIWSYSQWQSASSDVEGQVKLAVADAEKKQVEADEKKFADREKEPKKPFVGPDDYGAVRFDYPKTWSAYVATDPSRGGKYEAYFHPKEVPMVASEEQFAMRLSIEPRDYDQIIESYKSKVTSGDLRFSQSSANGHEYARYDGNFSNKIRGSAVVFKIRDKTLTLRTDANTFTKDFDDVIKTVNFNQ